MERFVILRDLQATRPASNFLMETRGAGPEIAAFGLGVPEPSIEVQELEPAERSELSRDPTVIGHAPEMPIQLIEPVPTEAAGANGGGGGPGNGGGGGAAAGGTAWGVTAVGADQSQFTGDGAVVAVLDTGIDKDHPAFQGVDLVQKDFSGSGDGDRKGHGTHCAGTIFGRDVDGERIGIARGVSKALIGKVLDDTGRGSSASAFEGIKWASGQGAQVISMSLGFDFPGLVKQRADSGWPVDLATSAGLEAYRGNLRMFDALMSMLRASETFGTGSVLVAAAGNESKRNLDPNYEIAASLPAAAEGVVSVGALGQAAQGLDVAFFSNTLPVIAAPGVDISSAKVGGGTKLSSGTSMACPHVAGVAALWWEAVVKQGVPATAKAVVAKVLAAAKTNGLAPGLQVADRGMGLVTAP